MPVQTVTKQKGTRTCRSCGSNLAAGATKCQNCGSTDIKKVRIVIKKTETTGEDALRPDSEEEVVDDEVEDDDEDLTEDDFEPSDEEDDEDDDDDEDEEDSEDEESDEDDEEDEKKEKKVTKRIVRRRRVSKNAGGNVNLDIMLAGLTVIDDIMGAVAKNDVEGDESAYERGMNAFNNVVDEVMTAWLNGDSVSKEGDDAKLKRLKAKLARLKAQAGAGDDDDVEKSDNDIFKGLNPAAAAILKRSQAVLEEREVEKFEGIAKSLGELSVSDSELGAALRHLSDTDQKHFATVEKALKAAAEAQKQSDIFKSFGSVQPGIVATGDPVNQLETITKSILDGNKNLTQEQAYAEAINQNPALYDQILASK